jgi:hypothetical protein
MSLAHHALLIALYAVVCAAQDYCDGVEAAGLTDCSSCVEITILGGKPDVSDIRLLFTPVLCSI